jgi:tetratricopeptide (TPR) repeat protein
LQDINYTFNDWYNNGIKEYDIKDYKRAIILFTKAIEKKPKLEIAYRYRGLCFSELKQYPEASEDITKVIKLNPKNASMYNIRGEIYGYLTQYPKAILDLKKPLN